MLVTGWAQIQAVVVIWIINAGFRNHNTRDIYGVEYYINLTEFNPTKHTCSFCNINPLTGWILPGIHSP